MKALIQAGLDGLVPLLQLKKSFMQNILHYAYEYLLSFKHMHEQPKIHQQRARSYKFLF